MRDQVTFETMSGKAIDLPQNFTIQLDLINSVFDTEVLRGSFSMPVQIPATPRNRVLFGFPEQPRSTSSVYKIDIRIRYGSMTLIGVLRLKDTTEKAFSSTVIAGVGTVAEALRTTKLTELDLKETFESVPPEEQYPVYFSYLLRNEFYISPPPIGTTIRFSIYRYTEVPTDQTFRTSYGVVWQGNHFQFLQDCANKINDRNPIQNYSVTQTYQPFDLVIGTDGAIYEAGFGGAPAGKPLLVADWSATESYVVGDYVEGIGAAYKCIVANVGIEPPNAAYWVVEDYPYWLRLVNSWSEIYLSNSISPGWYKYEDPRDNYSILAEATATKLILYDKLSGVPYKIDPYLNMDGQLYIGPGDMDTPDIFSSDAFSEVPPPGFSDRFDIGSYMLDKIIKFYPEATHTFVPYYNPNGSQDPVYTDIKHVNYYAPEQSFLTGDYYSDLANYLCQPQLYLFYILEKIFDYIGYEADLTAFDLPAYEEYKQLIVYNNNSMEGFINAVLEYQQRATPITEIDLSQHVPDVTLGEFLNAIRSMLGWQIDFKLAERRVEVKPLRELLNPSQLLDLTEFCEPQAITNDNDTGGFELQFEQDATDKFVAEKVRSLDDLMIADPVQVFEDLPAFPLNPTEVRLVVREGAYYRAVLDEPTDTYYWEYHSEALQHYTVDEGGTTLTTKAMPFTMFRGEDQFNASRLWTVPQFDQPLSLTGRGQNRQPFGIRLGFYRGLQRDSNNAVYPLATPDVWTYQGLQVGEKSLRWEGEYGIYEQLYKHWLQFLTSARIVKMQIRYEPYHLNSLNFGQVVRINGTRYVVFRIRVALPITKTAEVEMYRL